jgi:AraC family transcriptional regulator
MQHVSPSADRPLEHAQVELRRWSGVEVFRSLSGPGTFSEHAHAQVQVSIRLERQGATARAVAGSLCIVESGEPHGGKLLDPAEFLLVYFEPERLEEDAHDLTGRSLHGVRSLGGERDAWMTAVLAALGDELQSQDQPALVAEALGLALRTRLVTHHGSGEPPPWSRVRPLAPRHLREACGLLGEAFSGRFGVADIAGHLGLGTSRFAKAFRASVGLPPHTYLMRRRLELAERLLAGSALPLADIAAATGFASQSHMTEQFRRRTGVTPAVYRRSLAGFAASGS